MESMIELIHFIHRNADLLLWGFGGLISFVGIIASFSLLPSPSEVARRNYEEVVSRIYSES